MADSTTFEDADSTIRREGGLVVWRMSPSLAEELSGLLEGEPGQQWEAEMVGLRRAAALATKVPAEWEGT